MQNSKLHLIDKVASFLMVIAGLAFLAFVPAASAGSFFIVGVVVIVGGVLGLVNSQFIAPMLALVEKSIGVPLPTASVAASPTASVEASPSLSSDTSQATAMQQAAIRPPGTSAVNG